MTSPGWRGGIPSPSCRGRFFKYDEVDRVMHLSPKIHAHLTPSFASHVQDILEFRRIDYFRRRFKD